MPGESTLKGDAMASVGTPYTSGDWVVSEGREDEFVAAWTEFVRWSVDNFPSVRWATLVRQDDEPRHFLSFGEWADAASVTAWRKHPEFPQKLGAARSLCDSFVGLDYAVAVGVP
jgi:heme-degrading monooxygenase HmoA